MLVDEGDRECVLALTFLQAAVSQVEELRGALLQDLLVDVQIAQGPPRQQLRAHTHTRAHTHRRNMGKQYSMIQKMKHRNKRVVLSQ